MEKPLVNQKYQLEKYPGKGGWTYVVITEIPKEKRARGGYVRIKGTVDGYEIHGYHLMPMKNGNLFFQVKADIRKKIRKKEGDYIHLIFYMDHEPVAIPDELQLCLLADPIAHEIFLTFPEGKKKMFIDWINSAKKMETKADRIAKTLDKIHQSMS